MKIEKVIDGLSKYIEDKMFPTMVNWQRVTARIFIVRAKKNPKMVSRLMPILDFFEYSDDYGNINIDDFISDFKEAVEAEGELEISIPTLGLKYKFTSQDVAELCQYIKN